MQARILIVALIATVCATTSSAADPQLLNLVMPDAKVMAGINVEQAKTTPFGQYVLSQLQTEDRHLKELAALTGFDPREDVRELLVASPGGNDSRAGIAVARGNFDTVKISAAVTAKGGSVETHNGVTLISDPRGKAAFAFPDSTLVIAGAPAVVKAAIDRRSSANSINPALAVKVNELSTTQDAWVTTIVPPASLKPPARSPAVPEVTQQQAFEKIQEASLGVKFGANVVVNAEAVAQTAQDATTIGDVVKFLASVLQLRANERPEAAALLQSLTVTTQGPTLNVSVSLPAQQFENLVKPRARRPRPARRQAAR
jgi:hypothetical protein